MATFAPAIIDFNTSVAIWTPPVIARSVGRVRKEWRPSGGASNNSSHAEDHVGHDGEVSRSKVGLVEPVKEHSPSAPSRRCGAQSWRNELKWGPSLTATGSTRSPDRGDQVEVHVFDGLLSCSMSAAT